MNALRARYGKSALEQRSKWRAVLKRNKASLKRLYRVSQSRDMIGTERATLKKAIDLLDTVERYSR